MKTGRGLDGARELPIICSATSVNAIQADRKFVTRRLSKRWLKMKAGDRLWARETLQRPGGDPWLYAADRRPVMVDPEDEVAMLVWAHHKEQDYCPSIHMPRWASRILLECEEDAREERLQDITEEEARIEGSYLDRCPCLPRSADRKPIDVMFRQTGCHIHGEEFRHLWSTLHTKPGERWQDNPTVVRVGRFRRIA